MIHVIGVRPKDAKDVKKIHELHKKIKVAEEKMSKGLVVGNSKAEKIAKIKAEAHFLKTDFKRNINSMKLGLKNKDIDMIRRNREKLNNLVSNIKAIERRL